VVVVSPQAVGLTDEDFFANLRGAVTGQEVVWPRELVEPGTIVKPGTEVQRGDLFKNVLCSLSGLLTVGGFVATAIPPHVQGLPILAAGVSAGVGLGCNFDDLERARMWRFRHSD
jgi:hypothetical protein